jgi:hypothetical protein
MADSRLSFNVEGVELRPRENPLLDVVPQSKEIPFDPSITATVFLHDDGRLYFKDNENSDPIPLSKVKNFYDRLRFEDGELRFYEEDLRNYVSLSDIVRTNNVTLKKNSVVHSISKKVSNPTDYDALGHIEKVIEDFGKVKSDIFNDFFEDGKKLFTSLFFSDEYLLYANGKSVSDTLIEGLFEGITVTGEDVPVVIEVPPEPVPPTRPVLEQPQEIDTTGLSTQQIIDLQEQEQDRVDLINDQLEDEFDEAEDLYDDLLEEYEEALALSAANTVTYKVYTIGDSPQDPSQNSTFTFLPNVSLFFQDDHVSFRKSSTDFSGKVELQGKPFSTFENYALERLRRFNGIGKYLVSVFGGKESDYPMLWQTDPLIIRDLDEGTFTLNPVRNAACGGEDSSEKPFAFNSSYPLFIGDFYQEGNLTVEYSSGSVQMRNRPTSNNSRVVPETFDECADAEGFVGTVKTNASYTYQDIDLSDDQYTQSGSDFEELNGPFYVNPFGDDPAEWKYLHDLAPFDEGSGIETLLPIRRLEICFTDFQFGDTANRCPIYDTFPFCRGEWCNNTKFPPLPPEPTGFPTVFSGELWGWYNVPDNKDHLGEITYTYKWEPNEGEDAPVRSKIRGTGIFNDIPQLREFQDNILSDLSNGFSEVIFRFIVEEFKSLFIRDNLLTVRNGEDFFRDEQDVLGIVDMDDYFTEVKNRLENQRKQTLVEALTNVIDWTFAPEKTKITEDVSIGGSVEKLVSFDYRKLFGLWFDVPDFNLVIPPIDNDTGLSITATMSPFFTSKNDTRFEFRLYDATTDTQLDTIFIDTKQIKENELKNIGDVNRSFLATFPIQLTYFGPAPRATCEKAVFDKKLNICQEGDIKSHIALDINECFAEDVIDSENGFRVVADRYLKNAIATDDNVVDLKTPRVIKVQWRMIGNYDGLSTLPTLTEKGIPTDIQTFINEDNISNMLFSFDGSDSFRMRISANAYDTGGNKQTRLLRHGNETFNDVDTVDVVFNFMTKAEGEVDYSVDLQCDKNINVWVENKTLKGFRIKSESIFTGTVDWVISQPQPDSDEDIVESFDKKMPTCFIENDSEYNKSNFDIFTEEGYEI